MSGKLPKMNTRLVESDCRGLERIHAKMHFWKYHGLGNDYLVLEPAGLGGEALSEKTVRRVCHRHYGVGSDGILLGPIWPWTGDYRAVCKAAGVDADADMGILCALRIFNPDGSEAEKSGNGLRIFARHLYERHGIGKGIACRVATLGGVAEITVHDPAERIKVAMGAVTFASALIPVSGPAREVLEEEIEIKGRRFRFCAASVGNPHCVVLDDAGDADADFAREYGPGIETAAIFPKRTNVQFMRVLGRHDLSIEIWERGAGYTLASGSSASASAAVAVRLGLCASPVAVHMPGGELVVDVSADGQIVQTGPVGRICEADWTGTGV